MQNGNGRYILDALYGVVRYPDYIWEIALSPEFQRLREVRMCNINSLCLTGGANINRFEHCLGVAHLAMECIDRWPLRPSGDEVRLLVLAALLHDIGSTAFGHSVQYVLDRRGFQHQSFEDIVLAHHNGNTSGFAYQHTVAEPIYFGLPKRLAHFLSENEVRTIADIVDGRGPYGPLISGTIDLDNIDNVYRLAYHMGLISDGRPALQLSTSLTVGADGIVVREGAEELVSAWYRVRKRLYEFLLLNPDEFSAKCMLQEALELAESTGGQSFNWNDVDFQLLEKLARCSDDIWSIVSRLATGDLYGCAGLFSTSMVSNAGALEVQATRKSLESALTKAVRAVGKGTFRNTMVAVHVIKDVDKTERQIALRVTSGAQLLVGTSSRRFLIGVFFKNVGLSMNVISGRGHIEAQVADAIRCILSKYLSDPNLCSMELYSELTF
jgi:hypothetical protein